MKPLLTIFVDINNTDNEQRVRLNTEGALRDIEYKKIQLKNGLVVMLDDRQEFKVRGVVEFSEIELIWVARPDWNSVQEY